MSAPVLPMKPPRIFRLVRSCKIHEELTLPAGTRLRAATAHEAIAMLQRMLVDSARLGMPIPRAFVAQACVLPDGSVLPFDEEHWLALVTPRRRR